MAKAEPMVTQPYDSEEKLVKIEKQYILDKNKEPVKEEKRRRII